MPSEIRKLDIARESTNVETPKIINSWKEYISTLANLGYFPGFYSPEFETVTPLTDLFKLYNKPLAHFGNMRFLCEWENGYRAYNPLCVGGAPNDLIVVGFSPDGVLQFIWGNYVDSPYNAVSSGCAMPLDRVSEDLECLHRSREFVKAYGADTIRSIFKYVNFLWAFDYAPAFCNMGPVDTSDKYISDKMKLKSYRGLPLFECKSGVVWDIMRGFSVNSLGTLARHWGDTAVSLVLNNYRFVETIPLYLRYGVKCCQLLDPVVQTFATQTDVVDGQVYTLCVFDADREEDTDIPAMTSALTSLAYGLPSTEHTQIWYDDKVSARSMEYLDLLRSMGVQARQTGPDEFECFVGDVPGGYCDV